MIYVIATLTLKPGTLKEFMEAADLCIAATRKEPGCVSYDLHQSLTDENSLVFVERWETKEAIHAHFKEPHLVEFGKTGGQYLTGRKIEMIEPAGVTEL